MKYGMPSRSAILHTGIAEYPLTSEWISLILCSVSARPRRASNLRLNNKSNSPRLPLSRECSRRPKYGREGIRSSFADDGLAAAKRVGVDAQDGRVVSIKKRLKYSL